MVLRRRLRRAGIVRAGVLVAVVSLLGSCGSSSGRTADGKVRVEASFYPLQWVAQEVGGRHVEVSSLTKPGAEPHDLELTPREVGAVQDAGVVVYLSGFQPSVDDAVADASGTVLDAKAAARLDLTFRPIEGGEVATGRGGAVDPHFWLDPTRLASVASAFARTMSAEDPDHAADYRANAKAVRAELATLDGELRAGLEQCRNRELVTSHNAFGYLAQRYGLEQVGITGLTPEDEPSPKDLAHVADFVDAHQVRTIYFENLVSPSIARTVASETGVRTDVLDPIEGIDSSSQGSDYLAIMRSNLANLRRGQPCP